jgi:hypothetical protein
MRIEATHHAQSGFSFLDVMIAMTILLVGVLAFAAALTAGVVRSGEGATQLRAKELATSTLENVLSARYISVGGNPYSFDSIQNVSAGGLFVSGKKPFYPSPGPDGLMGTSDDTGTPYPDLEREITITDVQDPNRPTPPNPITERRVSVTVYYKVKGFTRQVTLTTNVCNY